MSDEPAALTKGQARWKFQRQEKARIAKLKAELAREAESRALKKAMQSTDPRAGEAATQRAYNKRIKREKDAIKQAEMRYEARRDPGLPHIDHSVLEAQAYAKLIQRITAAREDPCAFIEFVMRDPRGQPLVLAPFQREWIKLMREEPRIFIEASRSHGKSTLTIAFVLWLMGKNPNIRIKLLGQNDTKAKERLYEIRINLESNAALRLVFPNLKPGNTGDWTKSRLFIQRETKMKDPTLEAVGITSSIVGSRIDVIVADDIVDLRNAIMYPSLREVIKAKFLGELMPTLEPDGKVITIGTPWAVGDIYNLLRTTPGWKYVKYAIGTPEDPFAPLWPERWPREKLIKMRAELGSLEFDRAFRCMSITGEAVPCHPDWIRYYTKELLGDPNKLVCVQGYDLAISQAASADYFACTTILYDPSRNLVFVADAWKARLSFSEQAQAVISEATRWRPDAILIEKVGLGGSLENFLREKAGVVLPLQAYIPRGDKRRRFMEITPLLEDSRLFFHPNMDRQRNVLVADRGDIVGEMLEFPLGQHDDMCVVGGTLVRSLIGYKPIEEIQVGEPVLTHRGRFRRVLAVHTREAATLDLKVTGTEKVGLTSNHPLDSACASRPGQRGGLSYSDRAFRDLASMEDPRKYGVYAAVPTAEVAPIINLQLHAPRSYVLEGNFLVPYLKSFAGVVQNPKGKPVPALLTADKDLAWMLGLWLAEGSVGAHNVSFASHTKEHDVRERLAHIVNRYGLGQISCFPSKHTLGAEFSVGNRVWAEWLRAESGKWKKRRVPSYCLMWPRELQMEMLLGYFLGDGHVRKDGGLTSASCSRALSYGLREMLLRCGVPAVLDWQPHVGYEQWRLTLNRQVSGVLTERIAKEFPSKLMRQPTPMKYKNSSRSGRPLDDGFVYRIRGVTPAGHRPVYNLFVEEDNSYTANGLSVHNCDSLVTAVSGLRDFRPEGAEAGWSEGDGLNARLSVLDV